LRSHTAEPAREPTQGKASKDTIQDSVPKGTKGKEPNPAEKKTLLKPRRDQTVKNTEEKDCRRRKRNRVNGSFSSHLSSLGRIVTEGRGGYGGLQRG